MTGLSIHLCAAKQHKIRVFCYHNLCDDFQVEICKLGICFIRCNNAVNITVATLVNQCKCHFMCYVDTSSQEVSGLIYSSSSEQFSCLLTTVLTGPKKNAPSHIRTHMFLHKYQIIAGSHLLLTEITWCIHSHQLYKPVLYT